MLKILQIATVIIFAAMVAFGVGVVVIAPDRIGAYGQLVGILLPAWLTSITAALLGRPITDAAAGLRAKLEGQPAAAAAPEAPVAPAAPSPSTVTPAPGAPPTPQGRIGFDAGDVRGGK